MYPDIDIQQLKAEKCRRSFYYFLQEFWEVIIPEQPVYNWHIKYLCDQLQEVGERVIKRLPKDKDLIINVPPSTSKSTICSIMFPVWLWCKDPTIKVISASYSSSLSLTQSTKSRLILKSDKYQTYFPYVELLQDQDTKGHYETTMGGSRYTTSTGATVTGLHGHIIIVDDPQSPELANSSTERQNTNEWVSSTLSTRKVDKAISVMITIQQRLHPQDVTGYLLSKGKDYFHICLPAELNNQLKPSTLSQFYKQALLDPVRLSPAILKESRIDLGTRSYNTQILQSPEDDSSSILKPEWITILPSLPPTPTPPIVDFYLDSAYTDKAKNDPSAIIAVTKIDNILYILNVSQVWMEFPALVAHIQEFVKNNGYSNRSRIIIEPKASGLSISQYLRRQTSLNVIESKAPTQSKLERLHAISPKIEGKRLALLQGSWNELLLSELTSNQPVHDDLRDCVIMSVEDHLVLNSNRGKYTLV